MSSDVKCTHHHDSKLFQHTFKFYPNCSYHGYTKLIDSILIALRNHFQSFEAYCEIEHIERA